MTTPKRRSTGMRAALLGALFLAALSTFGDWIWWRFIPRGEVVHGVVHGAVVFAAIGLVLGLAAGGGIAIGRAVAIETGIGIVIAASFYPLYHLIGVASLFVTWMALWIATALLGRTLGQHRPPLAGALGRGAAAAVLSGLAFWAVSGIWTRPDPAGPPLAWHFACWTFAFLPGFAALFVRRSADDRETVGGTAGADDRG